MNYKDFWDRVNNLIHLSHKTQRGLALECGFTERRIESLSSASRSPDVIEAVLIAEQLGTTVEYLVTGENPVDNSQALRDKIQEAVRVLTS